MKFNVLFLSLASCLAVGCSNGVQTISLSSELESPRLSSGTQCQPVARTTLQRLNREEYNNTLRDLLGISLRPADSFPEDAFGETFNNNADALTLNADLLDLHITAAGAAIEEAFRLNKTKFMLCTASTTACATQILTPFLEKAYRRPVTAPEVTRLTGFVAVATGQGDSFERGIKLAMQAALSSPEFLYRSLQHSAPNDETRVVELSEYELASRLSYFLWSSMPDDQLFAAAKSKTLKQSLGSHVTRMLKDVKAQALINNFASQWLSLHRVQNVQPNKTMFPEFNEALRAAILTETKMLLNEIFTKNLSPHDLVTADYTFVNAALASHYGLPGVTGSAFQKVQLAGSGRQGLLGHASVNLLTSHSDYPSIIFRGKFVVGNLLCDPPSPPPTMIPTLPGSSELERSSSRLSDMRCMGCHTRMDPIGYALQGFDALGRTRTRDESGLFIDGKGNLPSGETFTGPVELSQVVASDARFKSCVAKRLLSYALARDIKTTDSCTVNQLAQTVGADQPISQVIAAIVESEPFRKQRGDGSAP